MSVLYAHIFIVYFAFDKILLKNSTTTTTTTTTTTNALDRIKTRPQYRIDYNPG